MERSDLPSKRRIGRAVVAGLLALLLITVAAVVLLHLTNPRPHKQIGWARVEDMPSARGEMASTMDGYRMVAAGGLYGLGRVSRAVSVYDIRQRQWYIGSPLPQGRHHAAAATLGDTVYVAGGASSVVNAAPRRDVWSYVPGYTWHRAPSMPEGRAGHAMVAFGSRIYVFGGVGRTNDTLVFDGHRWTRAAPIPAGRNHLRAVVWGKQIWVIGGRTSRLTARIDVYDPSADRWTRGPDLPKPMSAMAVAVLDDTLHVMGGENPSLIGGHVFTDHFILRRGATRWQTRPSPMLAVHGAAFGYTQGVLFVAGGAARPGALSILSWTNVTQFFTTIPQQLL